MLCLFLFGTIAALSSDEKIIHVYVALCDNQNQGIVPVPAHLGNSNDAAKNLYWGAAFGVKTFFKKSPNWSMLASIKGPKISILERIIFKHNASNTYLVADGYRGKEIKTTIIDFLEAASGNKHEKIVFNTGEEKITISAAGQSDLLVYVGHNGLMDFIIDKFPEANDTQKRDAMIIACRSKFYFKEALQKAKANPLLWTTGLLAAEAYTLENAIEGWIKNESTDNIRERAAKAYHAYQKCGIKAARKLFDTGY
ncbi:MAG: hypothetical protein A2Y62_07955 [Candidatus Fischerbacteria bacterium RBG_13_37_8]|uniref:Uncharacterized protein n=1 Tax=Candidatus Fischerbacteria bacterium RBG_13_37_8 TaxID=1817863 RepID=A0A1F5V6S3_9BACT|nr:MAG: hypothetical protein A2Y62_07955 [Candidatus Fischerbacteria bacterium RBG_13_37_8]